MWAEAAVPAGPYPGPWGPLQLSLLPLWSTGPLPAAQPEHSVCSLWLWAQTEPCSCDVNEPGSELGCVWTEAWSASCSKQALIPGCTNCLPSLLWILPETLSCTCGIPSVTPSSHSFDTVQIRHFRESTWLSCPHCRDSINSSIIQKLNNKAQCSQAPFYFQLKRSVLMQGTQTTTQALSLHVPFWIFFCFFTKKWG